MDTPATWGQDFREVGRVWLEYCKHEDEHLGAAVGRCSMQVGVRKLYLLPPDRADYLLLRNAVQQLSGSLTVFTDALSVVAVRPPA